MRAHVRGAARIVAAGCALSLAVGIWPAEASQQPTRPRPSQNSATGVMRPTAALIISAHEEAAARPGGSGLIEVDLTSGAKRTAPIDGLRVRIDAPRATALESVTGVNWSCATQSRAQSICSYTRTLNPYEDPAPIMARVAVAKSMQRAAVLVSTRATWETRRSSRGWISATQAELSVRPRLRATLTSPAGRTADVFRGGGPDLRQIPLLGTIGNIAGGQVKATWFQTRGPAVEFLAPTHVTSAQSSLAQTVQLPRDARAGVYEFGLRLESDGARVTRKVSVRVRAATLTPSTSSPRVSMSELVSAAERPRLQPGAQAPDRPDVFITGDNLVPAGRRVTLTVQASQGRVASARWVVDGKPLSNGLTASVSATPTPGGVRSVTVKATLRDGTVSTSTFSIMSVTKLRSPDGRSRALPSAPNVAAFCSLANAVRDSLRNAGRGTRILTLGADQTFTFDLGEARPSNGVFDSTGVCTGEGDIAIAGGVLAHSKNVRITQLTAALSATGLDMTKGRWALNTSLNGPLTDGLGLTLTGEVTSRLSDGTFGAVEGSMTFDAFVDDATRKPVNGLTWIPLPTGWEFLPDASQVYFVNSADSPEKGPKIADGTVRLAQLASAPADSTGARGTIALTLDVHGDSLPLLRVDVASVTLGETPAAGLLQANGTAAITLKDLESASDLADSTLHFDITCLKDGSVSDTCEVVKGLALSDIAFEWDRNRISLAAKATARSGANRAYSFSLAGVYRDTDDWSLSARSTSDWALGRGMVFRNLRGSVAVSSRAGSTDGRLIVDFTGTFAGLSIADGVTVTKVTPHLSNLCPADNPSCTEAALRLSLDARIEATLAGQSTPAAFDARAQVNLDTLAYAFEADITDANVGPDLLKLHDLKIVVTNDRLDGCVRLDAEGNPLTAADGTALRVVGQASILENDYTLSVTANRSGTCIWGTGDTIDLGNGFEAVTPHFSYTSYAEGAQITYADGDSLTVKPEIITLVGGFRFGPILRERFNVPGKGVTFTAKLNTDLSRALFAVSYNANGEIDLYRGAGASLTLGTVGFTFEYSPGTLEASLLGTGLLTIAGGEGESDSQTPVGVRGGLSFDATGPSLAIQAGVANDQPVANAFGQRGLTLRTLAVSAEISLTTGAPTISINADVTLPNGWNDTIGIRPGTPINLSFTVGAAAPCLVFGIGREGAGVTAVDVAGLGLMTTSYLRLVLAPMGCRLPVGAGAYATLPVGWSFSFEGNILGGPVTMSAGIGISSRGLTLNADVEFERWDLYGITFRSFDGRRGPTFHMDIDTSKAKYKVTFDGGIEFGRVSLGTGALVAIAGNIDLSNPKAIVVDITGSGAARLASFRFDVDPLTIKGNFPRAGQATADNRMTLEATVGVSVEMYGQRITARGALDIQEGTVASLHLSAYGSFDLFVAEVRGTIAFDMCLGTLSAFEADGSVATCTLFPKDARSGATYSFRVGIVGKYRVAWKTKDYRRMLTNTVGTVAAA